MRLTYAAALTARPIVWPYDDARVPSSTHREKKMSENGTQANFREVQWMRRVWWVMVLIAAIAVMSWNTFIRQIVQGEPVGTTPGPDWSAWLLWILFGIGFPVLFLTMRLVVEVRGDHVFIRYVPFVRRRISFEEIARAQARTYSPIGEYGGWGIRGWWSSSRTAYSISGAKGVELALKDGRQVMIGSRRPEELAAAIVVRM
jgi:hypothetical protein